MKAVVCPDGSWRGCTPGTEIGCEVEGPLCTAKTGYKKAIACFSDMSIKFCDAGSQKCVDNSSE